MSMAPGTRLGPYEVLTAIGAGGMGEVYRAKDTKLKREVALKVLPDSFAGDPARLTRFQREAEVLASLNHPHIAQVYGVEDRALVMELVEGATLSGPLPMGAALDYARQIAEALEYAHERGVIHRDLKPSNVKATPEGGIKLLDFGLAKAIEDPGGPSANPADSPTLTLEATRVGVILGTAAYMSPEQASGKTADRRSDIWSFGALLYEMLSGKRAFAGESVSDTLATVLKLDPDWNALPAETPASIVRLIRRCLTKDRKQRLQAIGEARIAIEAALSGETPLPEGAAAPGGARRLWLAWSVAAVLAVGLGPVAFLHFREKRPAPAAPLRFQIPAPENATFAFPSLSPDGRKLAFWTGSRLWVHFLESGESRDLTAADGPSFWSPDSRFIAYASQGKLKKIEATGGPFQTVTDFSGQEAGGAWNQDGVIVFGTYPGVLFQVAASGGVPVAITALDPARQEVGHGFPSFLPDGRHFIYLRYSSDPAKSAISLGSLDAKPGQQSSKPLMADSRAPVYAPSADPSTGYLVFIREGTLLAQPFDNRRLELKGQATPVAERVGGGDGVFSGSADVLVFSRSATSVRQLTRFDRKGHAMGTLGEPGSFLGQAEFSPDGKRVAMVTADTAKSSPTSDIWISDLRGFRTRLTFGPGYSSWPVWSPDGSAIAFYRGGKIYRKAADGTGDEEMLPVTGPDPMPSDWSRDGRYLLYSVQGQGGHDIWARRQFQAVPLPEHPGGRAVGEVFSGWPICRVPF
ncbi:MAG TPA: protein kinase [Bryobacteraceae bacterium]